MKHFFKAFSSLLIKDLLIDLRRKEHFISMLIFSLVVLMLFYFALGEQVEQSSILVPGLMWVTFIFSGILGLSI